jgi:amino acid adenylation domain-containing protein
VLKAGAVFAILDPAYPKTRLADYIDIAQARAWLEIGGGEAGDELAAVAGSLLRWRVSVPNGKAELARLLKPYPISTPSIPIDADTPAYVAFTSGSTGGPKGVLGRHGPMTHFLPWQQAEFGLTENDRYALLSGLAYNHLHRDLFTALASGAKLFVPTTECLKEPELLFAWLRERAITVLHLTPALGRLLTTISAALPALRRIFIGGDVLRREDARALHELAPNAAIVSLYGATETQRAIGYLEIADDLVKNDRTKATLPTGRGAPGVQLLLLREDGQLAGIGEVGDLYIRSPHLAANYVNDDALTSVNFIVNPFTGDRRDRLYRTGDRGRYLPDGNVAWAGRTDRCVSIRGFRVELAEVEAVLSRCTGVRNAAVLARAFSVDNGAANDDISLAAYVELTAPVVARAGELRRFAGANLPHYMVPAYFKIIDRLPLNPNGKVDYAALPARDRLQAEQDVPIDSPRNDLERNLAKVFCHVLRIASIDRNDSFFELGGHSLLAAQAAARIREAMGVKLDLRSFLETPTVAGLAARIEAMADHPLTRSLSPAGEREEIEL